MTQKDYFLDIAMNLVKLLWIDEVVASDEAHLNIQSRQKFPNGSDLVEPVEACFLS